MPGAGQHRPRAFAVLIMSRASRVGLATALCAAMLAPASVRAADLGYGRPHHRHHVRDATPIVVPQGYAYGGYGNGPGPGWVEGYGPSFAPGITPGVGYIPAGAAPTIFDLGR